MTTEKDSRLVDYLYGELSDEEAEAFERALESDEALSSELEGFEETLQTLRQVENEDPPPHLDSLILAHARQAAEEQKKRGWWRKLFASPVAGLVTAASVVMVAAIVAVPSMMRMTSEEAAYVIEQIPAPVSADEAKPEAQPLEETKSLEADAIEAPRAERTVEAKAKDREVARPDPSPKKKKAVSAPAVSRAPKPELKPETPRREKPPAIPKRDDRARTTFGFDDDAVAGGLADGKASGPSVGSARPALPPAPPPEPNASEPEGRVKRRAAAELQKSEEVAELESTVTDAPPNDEAAREERGRSMLAAASAEFKRGNPESGRQILVRALSVVGGAPVHAEIAFRLAQHDLSRGAYREAVQYARIAASAPKFDKRNAALEILVEAEKRMAEAASGADVQLAPAAPPADTDEAR